MMSTHTIRIGGDTFLGDTSIADKSNNTKIIYSQN